MGRPRSDIQPRIVRAARTRFLEDGVDGASLREIARDAATNIGMIVYYFPTKDDLFLAVVEEVYAKILVDLEEALGGPGKTRVRLHRALVRLGTSSDHELEVVRLVVREALLSKTRFRRIVERFMRGHLPLFIAALADGVAGGEFDPSVPMPLLIMSVIGLGGVPQLIRHAVREVPIFAALPDAEGLAAQSLALLYRAVGPRRAKRRAGAVVAKRSPKKRRS